MTPEEKAAYLVTQSTAAFIELMSMLAANHERRSHGYADAFGETEIRALIGKYDLNYGTVGAFLIRH
ncbi:hypothetical protein LCGC14_0369810 [marine sediment metagenome]|uniref:Uncharacterized protein n=1 Tax=marine sediment metagenome TaxID=412755 RepID=A0A0F9TNH8_9ZZZZ